MKLLHSVKCMVCGDEAAPAEPLAGDESKAFISNFWETHKGLTQLNFIERKDPWPTTASDTPAASPETI